MPFMTLLEVGIGQAGGGTVVGGLRLAGGGSESGAVCVELSAVTPSKLLEDETWSWPPSHGSQPRHGHIHL